MRERNLWRVLLAILVVFGLVVAGCGNDDDDAPSSPAAAGEEPDDGSGSDGSGSDGSGSDGSGSGDADAPEDMPEVMSMPGEGVSVSMARANWSTGYMQAAIYRTLLQELGYEVSDPAEAELAPATFYPALGEGEYDLWVNGWFPIHTTLIDDAGVADVVSPIGNEIVAGGLQGFIVDKATAEANGITMLDDIGDNPEMAALFDVDGNGKADLMGCNDGWGCQVVINDTIAQNGWEDTIEQVSAEHAALFADSVGRFNRGESILQYIWTPGAFTAELVPGSDVIWLSVGNPLPSQVGAAALPAEQCPGQPCEMGFVAADIRVVASNEFLVANPAAAALLEAVSIPVIDIALQNLAYDGGANTEADVQAAADDWIAANRATVDEWLAAARSASGFTPPPPPEPEDMEPFRVAVVAPSASNDLAFTQSMYDAVNSLVDSGEIAEFAITDGTFIVEDAAAAIRGYADDGYDLVIAHGSQYGGPLQEIAPDFPDVSFAWGTAVDTFGLDNVYSYSVRSDLGGYVNGVVAAQLTESNVIGVVGPIEVGDAKLYVDGFAAGATAQNPDVEVNIVYTGSFADVALAAEAAQSHISAGADVLTGSAQMVVGATGVAQENDVLWFGTQANQTPLGDDIVVASQVYRWEVILSEVVEQVKAGTLGGTTFIMTFEGGGLDIQFNDAMNLPAEVMASAEATIAGLSDGSISTGQ